MSDPGSRTVRVRRGPRVWTFVAVGAVLGVIVAAVLTLAFPPVGQYSAGSIFGFFALYGLAGGALVGGLVAVVLDAVSRRRARTAVAERERIRTPDEGGREG